MSYKLKRIIFTLFLFSTFFVKAPASAQKRIVDVASATSPVRFTFNLTKSIPFVAANIPYDLGYKGQNSHIVIIDSGVQKDHPFFQDRVVLEACFSLKCPNNQTSMIGPGAAAPVHWHGTHVAGIAAGSSSSMRGIAPQANIIAVNVFDSTGSSYDSNIISALNWVSSISSQYNIASVNMSLGSSSVFSTTCDNYIPELTTAIKNLKDLNIATVVSSGNSYAHGMSSPACISHTVSVAAMYVNSPNVANFSNISKFTTFAAPGHNVASSTTQSSYRSSSGTSMAAPHIAGAFAVYRSKFGVQSVDRVVSDFKMTTRTATDSYTGIKIPYLHFAHLFDTVIPIPTTSTTTTTSSTTTTTTLPVVVTTTTTSTTSTSTTSTSTTSTTTTIPRPPSYGAVFAPVLHELDASWKTFIKAYYRDPYRGYANISHYSIICNDSANYNFVVPRTSRYGWNSFNIKISPSLISYCKMNTHGYNGKIVSTRSVYTTPVNPNSPRPFSVNINKRKNAK